MQSEAPFYSNFFGQTVKLNGPELAAITQNFHQVALFCYFLYSQVLPEVSPDMPRLLAEAQNLQSRCNSRIFPLPPSPTHQRGGFPKSAVSALSEIGFILSSFQASVKGVDSRLRLQFFSA